MQRQNKIDLIIFIVWAAVTAFLLLSLANGCAVVDRIHERLPYIEAKAPEIAIDVATKNWPELVKDVIEALGIDKDLPVDLAAIAGQESELRAAVDKKDWLTIASIVLQATHDSP